MLETGIKGYLEAEVTKERLASSLGSGGIDVFATPCMITGMEAAALNSVQPFVGEGNTTVGTALEIKHVSATPLGMKVHFESELIEIDRRRLVFKVTAYDETGLIGEGTHERFIVEEKRFLDKVYAKTK